MQRTRIKICGMTREEDVRAAVGLGADALGFVFYPKSPRYVTPRAGRGADRAGCRRSSASSPVRQRRRRKRWRQVARVAPLALIQFHGDETAAQCAAIAARGGAPVRARVPRQAATRPHPIC